MISTTDQPAMSSGSPSAFVRGARWLYVVCVGVFLASVVVQVFLAGAGALVSPEYWSTHDLVGHLIGTIAITILVVGLFGRLPWRVHGLNVVLYVLYVLQYVFLWVLPEATGMPLVRAFHAVNALTLIWLGVVLLRHGRAMVRSPLPAQGILGGKALS